MENFWSFQKILVFLTNPPIRVQKTCKKVEFFRAHRIHRKILYKKSTSIWFEPKNMNLKKRHYNGKTLTKCLKDHFYKFCKILSYFDKIFQKMMTLFKISWNLSPKWNFWSSNKGDLLINGWQNFQNFENNVNFS